MLTNTTNEDVLIFILEIGVIIIVSLVVAKGLGKRGIP